MRLPFASVLPFLDDQSRSAKVELPWVNLFPDDPFFDSLVGRVMRWLVGAGRHLIIFTEIVVITSFASRFVLDRQLSDLNTSLLQKKSVIQSYGTLEDDFRQAQQQVKDVERVLDQQGQLQVISLLQQATPPDVNFSNLRIQEGSVSLEGQGGSVRSVSLLVENLKNTPQFQRINVGKIGQGEKSDPTITFSIRFLFTEGLKSFADNGADTNESDPKDSKTTTSGTTTSTVTGGAR